MTEDFHRIRRLPPYVFAEVNAAKAKARASADPDKAVARLYGAGE